MRMISVVLFFLVGVLLVACTPPPAAPIQPTSVSVTIQGDPGPGYTGFYRNSGETQWNRLTFTNHRASFNVTGSDFSVAVSCENDSRVQVVQATVGEINAVPFACWAWGPSPPLQTFTVNIDASAIAADARLQPGDRVRVNGQPWGLPATLDANFRAVVNYEFLNAGSQDLVVTIFPDVPGGELREVRAAKVVRQVNVVAGGSTRVSFATGDLTSPQPVVINNVPTGFSLWSSVTFISADDSGHGDLRISNTSFRPVAGFQSGDRYIAFTMASRSGPSSPSTFQWISTLNGFAGPPLSTTLPDPWRAGSLSTDAQPLPLVTGLSYSQALAYSISYSHFGPGGSGSVSLHITPGFLAGSTQFDFNSISALFPLVNYTPPAAGNQVHLHVDALLSRNEFRRALHVQFTSDLDLRQVGASVSYPVGGGRVNFP